MFTKVITLGTIVAAAALMAVVTTVPLSAGPVGILAVFFLLYVVLTGVMALGGFVFNWLFVKLSKNITLRRPMHRITLLHSYYLASVLALGPLMLLGMNTVSRVGLYEVSLVILFVVIGVFYVEKRMN